MKVGSVVSEWSDDSEKQILRERERKKARNVVGMQNDQKESL